MKCGVGDYTALLAGALSRLPGVVVGVATGTGAREQPADLSFDVLPITETWSFREAPRIFRAIRRWQPDLVHVQYPSQGYGSSYLPWLIPAVLSLWGILVVQTWHEYYPKGCGRRNLLNALTPGGLVVVRPRYLEQMPAWYRRLVSAKHFRLIPNATAMPTVALSLDQRRTVRDRLRVGARSLVVYFGFAYPAKGVDLLFDIANPEDDHLVLVGHLTPEDPYHALVLDRLQGAPWKGHAHSTGFVDEHEAATVLAAADAVVLPFTEGGGIWNSSVHAAANQGVFVLTTSTEQRGYDANEHIYYAAPGNLEEMRSALRQYRGLRRASRPDSRATEWQRIARAHAEVYDVSQVSPPSHDATPVHLYCDTEPRRISSRHPEGPGRSDNRGRRGRRARWRLDGRDAIRH